MKPQVPPDAAAAWARGDKIEAIKRVREHTGLGLREAMQLLESGPSGPGARRPASQREALGREAAAALARGDLIETIRLIRKAGGLGHPQAQAQAHTERPRRAEGAATPARPNGATPRRDGLAPGEVPRSRVPLGGMIVVLAVAAAIYLLVR